jgi:hypothetical protein
VTARLRLRCGLYLDLGRVPLAVEFPLAKAHGLHDPAIAFGLDQQSTGHGCLKDDTDIRPAVGVVDENPVGRDGHARRLYTFKRKRAARALGRWRAK